MLISKEVEVKWCYQTREHYENLGYIYTKQFDKFIVPIEHLHKGSTALVEVKCDYCERIFTRRYADHTFIINREITNKDACKDCYVAKSKDGLISKYGVDTPFAVKEIREKTKQTFLDRYGVDNPFEIEGMQEQIKQTNLEKYGVEYYTQTDEYKIISKQTNLGKYGVDNPSKCPEIIDKIKDVQFEKYGMFYSQTDEFKEKYKNTCMEKYGVENSFQSEEVKNKIVDFNMNTYGVSHPMKDKNIAKKRIKKGMKTKYRNGTAPSSRQQEYIGKLFNGEVNFPVDNIWLDIKLNNTTFLGYDGSGHELRVSIGGMSQEKFDNEEMRRKYFLASKGWREIRIISKKDLLPSDIVIRHLVEYSMKYLDSGHSWIKFDIDNNKIICSQYEKTYDFGDLRKITDRKSVV